MEKTQIFYYRVVWKKIKTKVILEDVMIKLKGKYKKKTILKN